MFAAGAAPRAQPLQIVLQCRVIHIVAIRLHQTHHRVGTDKARKVVDVPVRVIADHATTEPDQFAAAKGVRQQLLHRGLADLAIATGVQQALFGGHDQAGAVALNCATFEHPRAALGPHRDRGCHGFCGRIVIAPRRILPAPGIETEVHAGLLCPACACVLRKHRTVITTPGVVSANALQTHTAARPRSAEHRHTGAKQPRAGACFDRLIDDVQMQHLTCGERGNGLHKRMLKQLDIVGPGAAIVRPGHPRALVALPLGRPADAGTHAERFTISCRLICMARSRVNGADSCVSGSHNLRGASSR